MEEFPWAGPVEGSPHRVFCHSCQSDFCCDHGTSELRRHQANSKHINNEINKTSEDRTGHQNFSITKKLETRQTYKCKWKAQWVENFPWSRPVEGNPQRVFCHSCKSDFACDHGASELRRHQNNSKHINNESKKTIQYEKHPQKLAIKKNNLFGCEVCGKQLMSSGGLIVHRRIHSGENPYNCTYCDFVTNDGSTLKRHLREKCKKCDYTCNRASNLRKHAMTHIELPHRCEHCDYSTKTKSSLMVHMMISHQLKVCITEQV